LPSLAAAGAVTQEPSTAEADCVLGAVRSGGDDVAGLIDAPRAGEMAGMGFTGIDDAFYLRIQQQAVVDDRVREQRSVRWLRRRDRGHRRRLDQRGRMRFGTW